MWTSSSLLLELLISNKIIFWGLFLVLLPGKFHGRRSLVGCSPWGRQESYTTERLHCQFSLSCAGEGNGNPLQCSCLENPRDREPGGLLSMGSHRVKHSWSDLAAAAVVTSFFFFCSAKFVAEVERNQGNVNANHLRILLITWKNLIVGLWEWEFLYF